MQLSNSQGLLNINIPGTTYAKANRYGVALVTFGGRHYLKHHLSNHSVKSSEYLQHVRNRGVIKYV